MHSSREYHVKSKISNKWYKFNKVVGALEITVIV